MTVNIRPMAPEDREPLLRMVKTISEFNTADFAIAEEVCDTYLDDPAGSGYHVYIAEIDEKLAGYIAYGPTPLTEGTWDIYWIAVSPREQGKGIGRALLNFAEAEMVKARARMVMIETSDTPLYEKTRQFHRARGYREVCRIPDFYSPGDGKLILQKRLDS